MKTLLLSILFIFSGFAFALNLDQQINISISQPGIQDHPNMPYLTMHMTDKYDDLYTLISKAVTDYSPKGEGNFIDGFDLNPKETNVIINTFVDKRILQESKINMNVQNLSLCFVFKYNWGVLHPYDYLVDNKCVLLKSLKTDNQQTIFLKGKNGEVKVDITME